MFSLKGIEVDINTFSLDSSSTDETRQEFIFTSESSVNSYELVTDSQSDDVDPTEWTLACHGDILDTRAFVFPNHKRASCLFSVGN